LYYDEEAVGGEFSRFGFELTFRLASPQPSVEEPIWVCHRLQNLARYVFDSGRWFEAYHWIPANGPLRLDCETDIVGLVFLNDPTLAPIDSPDGRVEFIQAFGVTETELDQIKRNTRTPEQIVEKHRTANPLVVTEPVEEGRLTRQPAFEPRRASAHRGMHAVEVTRDYIEGIYVAPSPRAGGHGRQLVEFGADFFRSKGCRRMSLLLLQPGGDMGADKKRVFVIYGRNTKAYDAMVLFLRSLGLDPWDFNQLSSDLGGAPFIGDIVRQGMKHAQAVVALFTPDELPSSATRSILRASQTRKGGATRRGPM
jgi:GNAT superfamily N-acetyltransferase